MERKFGAVRWLVLLVLIFHTSLVCGDVPTISASGVFIVGSTKTLLCYVTSDQSSPDGSFPLVWTRERTGNTPLVPLAEQSTPVPGTTSTSYISRYNFTVEKGQNEEIFTCTARLGGTEEAATWKVYVYKPPDKPVISGDTVVTSDVNNTWSCIVDGASAASPNVYWEFGNGTRILSGVTSVPAVIYQDPDTSAYLRDAARLELYRVGINLTLALPPKTPPFDLLCRAVHFETNTNQASDALSVTVQYPPIVQGNVDNYTTIVGAQATLLCTVEADPEVDSVTWYKDGVALTVPSTHYSDGSIAQPSLTINTVRKGDAGKYVCSATNSIGTRNSTTITLNVRFVPEISYTNTSFSGMLGQDLTLPCNIVAYPPVFRVFWWKLNDTAGYEIPIEPAINTAKYSGGNSTTPDLTIKNLTSDDVDQYRCAADNDVGRGEGAKLLVQVFSIPEVKPGPERYEVGLGSSLTIRCDFDATPPARSVVWYKESLPLVLPSEDGRLRGGSVSVPGLTITDVQITDTSVYQCRVTNSFGTGSGPEVRVDVAYAPIIGVSQDKYTVRVGNNVTLVCSITAYPKVTTVTWYKNNLTLSAADLAEHYTGGDTEHPNLHIRTVEPEDLGEYVCEASNAAGTSRSDVISLDVLYAPFVTVGADSYTRTEGETLQIACSYDANPRPYNVTWTKDAQVVNVTSSGGKYSGSTVASPSLTIIDLTAADAGVYTCVVENSAGVGKSRDVTLVVHYAPVIETPVLEYNRTSGESVTLECRATALPPVTDVTWYNGNNDLMATGSGVKYSGGTVDTPDLTINDLTRQDLSHYFCWVTNAVGSTRGPNITVNVFYAPVVSVAATSYTVTEGETLEIACSYDANPPPFSVTWTKDTQAVDVISSGGKYVEWTVANPNLTVTSLTREDAGVYVCTVENSQGRRQSDNITVVVHYAPVITTSMTSYNRTKNESVTLECQITALPNITRVTWYKGNNQLSVTGSGGKYSGGTVDTSDLTINSLTGEDTGDYFCEAENSVGTSNGPTITLGVYYAPIVSVRSTSYTMNEGQVLHIPCSYDASPNASNVTWTKNAETVDVIGSGGKYSGSTVDGPTLTINDLSPEDAGVYVCIVENALGPGQSEDVTLTVHYAPIIAPTVTSYNRTKGENVTLGCHATAIPPVTDITWYKGNNPLNVTGSGGKYSGGTVGTSDLTISALTGEDTDIYLCRATNALGSMDGPNIAVDVMYAPVVSVNTTSYTKEEGESLEIACFYDANPTPSTVTWMRNAEIIDVINSGERYNGSTVSTPSLTITQLGKEDAGTYVCVVENVIGSGQSDNITVVVNYLPVIKTFVTSHNKTEGDDVTLECNVTAVPPVIAVRWYKGGYQVIVPGSEGKYSGGTVDTPDLTISNLTGQDTGTYFCEAANALGASTGLAIHVNVMYAPIVFVDFTSYTETEGKSLEIACFYDANPAPSSVTWIKDAEIIDVISSGGKYTGSTVFRPSLNITQLSKEDAGIYSCLVENIIGTGQSDNITVVVNYLPVIGATVTSYNKTKGDNVTLECHIAAVPPATSVTWYKGNNQLSVTGSGGKYSGGSVDTPDLTISSLIGQDSDDYFCRVTSIVGSTDGPTIEVNVFYAPEVSVQSTAYTENEGESVLLACAYDANPKPFSVSWTKNGQPLDVAGSAGKYIGATVDSPSLNITQLAPEDAAVYVCVVENRIGARQSENVTLVVNYLPIITASVTAYNKTKNDSVTLECQISAVPPATAVTWYKDSNPVSVTGSGGKYSGGTVDTPGLTIDLLTGEDTDDYRCAATNPIGRKEGPVISVNVFYPPLVSVDYSSYTAKEGTSVQLLCSFDASPPASRVEWTKNAQTVDVINSAGKYTGSTVADPSLTIADLSPADAGTYVCIVRNELGSGRSANISLIVDYAPKITTSVTSYNKTKNENVTLECRVSAVPAIANVTWFKDNQLIVTGSGTKYTGGTVDTPDLTIYFLVGRDMGDYFCRVANSIGSTDGAVISVNVRYAPIVTIGAVSYTMNEGVNLLIPCAYDANPDPFNVTWVKDSQTIDVTNSGGKYSGATVSNPSLSISQLTPEDAGVYVCQVRNSEGLGLSADSRLVVHYAPKINVTVTAYNKTKLDSVTLECSARALPPITNVTWFKGSNQLTVTGSGGKYSGGTVDTPELTVTSLAKEDSDDYFCRVTNPIDSTDGPAIRVNVFYRPQISFSTPPLTATEGTRFTINCSYDANPLPTQVEWTKDGVTIDVTNASYSGGTVGTPGLTIVRLRPYDRGDYVCNATNTEGSSASAPISLRVKYKPRLDIGTQSSLNADQGNSVTIPCTVDADPDATSFSWRRNGDVIDTTDSRKYSLGTLPSPALTIRNLQSSDFGVYRCSASNEVGTGSSENVTLYVNYKPEITVEPNLIGNETFELTIPCEVDAFPALTSLTWYKEDQLLNISDARRYSGGNPSTPTLTILSLRADDDGKYYCVAVNSMGSTKSGTTDLDVHYKPVVVSPGITGGDRGSIVILNVTVSANPPITNVWWRKRGSAPNHFIDIDIADSTKYGLGVVGSPGLLIKNLGPADEGVYEVQVSNTIGSTTADMTVVMSYAPTSVNITEPKPVYKEGENITLTCTANGYPDPEFRWYRDDELYQTQGHVFTDIANPGNNKEFKCEAHNKVGSLSSTVSVNVEYKPRASNALTNTSAAIGEVATLVCAVDANPEPFSYTWTHNGKTVGSSRVLRVTVTNATDLGSYECTAVNAEGPTDPPLVVYISEGIPPSVGASSEASTMSTATLVLIIIVGIILLVVIVLIIIFCVCNRIEEKNRVRPARIVAAHPPKPKGTFNGRLRVDDDKIVNGGTTALSGLTISLPGGGTPRPHYLPPLGLEGTPQEKEPAALEDTPTKKKKRRRRRHDGDAGESKEGTPVHASELKPDGTPKYNPDLTPRRHPPTPLPPNFIGSPLHGAMGGLRQGGAGTPPVSTQDTPTRAGGQGTPKHGSPRHQKYVYDETDA